MKRVLRWIGRVILICLIVVVLAGATLIFLRGRGLLLLPQESNPEPWEVFGVDVSAYQGEVDWTRLAEQGVQFAFLKASEGSSLQDRQFAANWQGAAEAGVRAGAYHFFSYDSPGETQADNFISAVPVLPGALPPVVDIEFYGEHSDNPVPQAEMRAVLDPLLARLEARYGQKPILYVTWKSYQLYLSGGAYLDYPLWISRPLVAPLERDWTFWQYSHTARLEGYSGTEERIDLNVFRGTQAEFNAFGFA